VKDQKGCGSEVYFVLFEATPRRDAKVDSDVAGAYVSCWIERPTRDEAVRVARTGIEENGWIVGDPDEAYEVNAATYPPGKNGREFFQQALIDKEVFVYHTFPEVDDPLAGD
jgi:hypothetical protein